MNLLRPLTEDIHFSHDQASIRIGSFGCLGNDVVMRFATHPGYSEIRTEFAFAHSVQIQGCLYRIKGTLKEPWPLGKAIEIDEIEIEALIGGIDVVNSYPAEHRWDASSRGRLRMITALNLAFKRELPRYLPAAPHVFAELAAFLMAWRIRSVGVSSEGNYSDDIRSRVAKDFFRYLEDVEAMVDRLAPERRIAIGFGFVDKATGRIMKLKSVEGIDPLGPAAGIFFPRVQALVRALEESGLGSDSNKSFYDIPFEFARQSGNPIVITIDDREIHRLDVDGHGEETVISRTPIDIADCIHSGAVEVLGA